MILPITLLNSLLGLVFPLAAIFCAAETLTRERFPSFFGAKRALNYYTLRTFNFLISTEALGVTKMQSDCACVRRENGKNISTYDLGKFYT
jgi:hypothetical protein